MYSIEYVIGTTRHIVYSPFDNTRKIVSGAYHRETNTIGSLTFSVLYNHPCHSYFEEYLGVVNLYWNNSLIYKFRIIKIHRNFYNTLTIQCEGVLGYLNDSIVRPYTFNETHWLYPIGDPGAHVCTAVEFLRELIALHNIQVTAAQQFTFVDETNGAFDSIAFTTSQTSYVKSWDEIESKVIRNIGGYVQLRFSGGNNLFVFKAALTEYNSQTIRLAQNLKSLETETNSQKFATALFPISTYTDSNGQRQTIDIYNVNNSIYYVENNYAVRDYGRIIEFAQYEGITSASKLKEVAQRDLNNYINRGRPIKVAATDMAAVGSSYAPLEVDKKTRISSNVNGVDVAPVLNSFDVDILDPRNSTYTFNGEVPSFVRKTYTYRT